MAEQEKRLVCFDSELNIEACQFVGLKQKFPNHFHEYYVIGFVERGRRYLRCKNREYRVDSGDLLIFNPLDTHLCAQTDSQSLDWRCLNISEDVMRGLVKQITGLEYLPRFSSTVTRDSRAVAPLKELHALLMAREEGLKKEELLFFLIEQLLQEHTEAAGDGLAAASEEIQKASAYIEEHFAETISLDTLSGISGLNKYTLLRNFTKQRGVTPYQYLETLRISTAKKLLEAGADPAGVALSTGFADQSHFTKFFKKLIGLTPKQYGDIFKEHT